MMTPRVGPDLAMALGERARRAAAAGEATFAIPEAADADRGASYHDLVRRCAAAAFARGDAGDIHVAKAREELEPALALWPHVLLFPTTRELSVRELIELRAFPLHPLGVRVAPSWGDGRWCSPADFFAHDLDHARFKVREDLRLRGIVIPDAYEGGSTLDPATGRHRLILARAAGLVGDEGWIEAPRRLAWVRDLPGRASRLEHRRRSSTNCEPARCPSRCRRGRGACNSYRSPLGYRGGLP